MTRSLPRTYLDERAFPPFRTLPSAALVPGRLFYGLPHDTRRRAAALIAPDRYRALQKLRVGEAASGYSLKPFDSLKCIFIHVPKAAGVSVCRALFGGLAGGHTHIGMYQMVFSKTEFADYFKFTFVRNPWDRLLSAYAFLQSGGLDESDRQWSRANLHQFETFEDFVLGWVTEANIISHIHFIPQYRFVCLPFSKRIGVDFVGRYEHLERDFAHVRDRLGLESTVKLPHHNRGPGAARPGDFRRHYTAAMREVVERVYAQDIELFGYTWDDGVTHETVGVSP